MAELVLSHRFCISEKHGLQAAKYRLIDDITKSMANATVSTDGAYFSQDINVFSALSKYQRRPDDAMICGPPTFPAREKQSA